MAKDEQYSLIAAGIAAAIIFIVNIFGTTLQGTFTTVRRDQQPAITGAKPRIKDALGTASFLLSDVERRVFSRWPFATKRERHVQNWQP